MRYNKKCFNCSKEYVCYYKQSKYCCEKCKLKKEGLKEKECPNCRNIFKPTWYGQVYCCGKCYWNSEQLSEQAKNSKLIKDNSIESYEERYGKEKADEMKKKHSNFMKENPNSGQFKSETTSKEKNVNWKGDNVGYSALHDWVKSNKEFLGKCEICGLESNNRRIIEAANISGEYKRDINDFVWLCRSCHYWFDKIKKQKPYEVIGVEVKSNGYLDKTERAKCKWLLANNIFSKILIAKKGKKRGEIIYDEFK
ncbi:hypothetical protein KAI04_04330 [Candidatus Pacearchaeota archaeon]|nr:hypothetical protein [Candidatus Pacearchaeota archaeon]